MRERFYNLFKNFITILLFFTVIFSINLLINYEICVAKNVNRLNVGGNGEFNYSSIQEAVFDSVNGDTIFVYPGVYYENIVINKSISLLGLDKNNVSINGEDGIYSILVKSYGILISGFTIRNSNVGILISGKDFEFCNISDNIFTNNSEAIRLINTSNNNIFRNLITNHSNFGIVLYNSKENVFFKNTIVDNKRGIYLGRWSNNNLIFENNFTNYNYGLNLDYSFNNQIIDNLIQNGDYGIYLSNSKNNNITNNYIFYNEQSGIYISNSDENNLSSNIFLNNNQDINKKTNPPNIKTPGFEILLLILIIIIITLIKKEK